ncbi:hypothetical protein [Paenibacillus sp. P46E]|uniref:hypothetical protein n=1 Tax=Paenibacillus sp. P46E TaxID=1349436 RepID=UPI000A5F5C9C|nr:hypothetical protein [Paenibacillus sp. P46E]
MIRGTVDKSYFFKGKSVLRYNGIRNATVDFTNGKGKSFLLKDFADHESDFDFTNEQQYLNGARNFLEKKPTKTTLSITSAEGTYFRYDTASNEFGIINTYGGVQRITDQILA